MVAQTNVEYLEIDCQFFFDYLYNDPKMFHFYLSDLIKQYMDLAQTYQLMNEPIAIRIAHALIELKNKLSLTSNSKGVITFPKKLTQELIANYINASVSRSSTVFTQLERQKIIKRYPLRIIDINKLQNLRNGNIFNK